MIANINLETGIAFGIVSANSLHSEVVTDLMDNGTDVYYEDCWNEFIRSKRVEYDDEMERKRAAYEDEGRDFVEEDHDAFDPEDFRDEFNDSYEPDEPVHEGESDGVKYRTTWIGGALCVWVFESPHIGRFRQCSPCAPGAADLNSPDENGIEGYDVPPDWRYAD